MPFEHWLAFVAASAVLLAIPGPTVLLVVSYALGHGRRYAAATIAGVALGDLTAMTGSLLGLGALLAASAGLFTGVKWLGAAYLVYLGLKLWRAPVGDPGQADISETRPGRIFAHAYVVTALNPKGIVFFVAFLPQFLDMTRPVLPQMAILVTTFVSLAAINAALFGLMASSARRTIRNPSAQRLVNRIGGSFLIGAGLLTAAWRRAAA
jgi:threonine/homoserine/homoserine lactone efflux protein